MSLPKSAGLDELDKKDIIEVVLSHNSKLAGRAIKETDFRGKYDGAILAIHRNGERIWGQLGQQVLKAGDILVVIAGKDFIKRLEGNPNFYVLSRTKQRKRNQF